jgi:hypothetical protein
MKPLPTQDLRSNLGTWAIGTSHLPCVAQAMCDALPAEQYDPLFTGQKLCTYYFDTQDLSLWKARCQAKKYLTLRLREYPGDVWALSAKTEGEKFRAELGADQAQAIMLGHSPSGRKDSCQAT